MRSILELKKKKGIQLNQAFGAVLTLVLVAVLVIIAIVIYVNLATSFEGQSSSSTSGETITPTDTGVTVAAAGSNCSFGDLVITTANNATAGGVSIHSGNWSATSAGVVTNLTSEFTDSSWVINYTFTWGSMACEAAEDMTGEFSNYTSLIGLVGTIIFLGLVIGILVTAFAFGGRKEV